MEWLNRVDPTILVALLTTFSAVFAPTITAFINNQHQYKMRKLEIIQEKRIQAIQEYAESCSRYIAHNHRGELSEYSRSYGKIFLYADKKHWKSIKELHAEIENGNFQSAASKLADVCQALSSDMKI